MKKLIGIISNPGVGRLFFAYFTVSLLVIFVVVFSIQWSALIYFINSYEIESVIKNLSIIRQSVHETSGQHSDRLGLLKNVFLENWNADDVIELIDIELYPHSLFYVFNMDNELVYGYDWPIFLEYISIVDVLPENFLFSDNVTIYQVSVEIDFFYPARELRRYILVSLYSEPALVHINSRTIPYTWLELSTDRHLLAIYRHIVNQNTIQEFQVIEVDTAYAFGVYSQFGLNGDIVVVHLHEYHREIYQFLRNIYFLLIFIMMFSLFVLTTISFIMISNKIFNPLWSLIDKMKSISKEPKEISLVSETFKGEILQICHFFNEMAISIKNYQSELLKSKELFEKINIGIFWFDETGKIKLFNKSFKDIFGFFSPDEININDIIPISDGENKLQSRKIELNPLNIETLGKDLSIIIHSYSQDDHIEYFGIVSDITEELKIENANRSLELELVRINRLSEIGRRVQSIVHNLNTPLNSVMGYAQLALAENPENEDIKKIIQTAKAMSEIIKSLLQKTVDDSIAMPVGWNLNRLLKKELMFCTHDLFFKHNVDLKLDLAKKLPDLHLIYGDIAQVFQTLFNNAIDAMRECDFRKLTVSSFIKDKFVCFSLKDTGIGMTNDVLEKIFEPSFSTKTMTHAGGFGIGLSLAQAIINKLQGKIEVCSEYGKGSEFIVYLPMA